MRAGHCVMHERGLGLRLVRSNSGISGILTQTPSGRASYSLNTPLHAESRQSSINGFPTMSSTIEPADRTNPQGEAAPQASPAETSDGDLLRSFHRCGDEAAFGQLVARHTPMVFSVCVSVLQNRADAEDAFQAAFFVLARRSRSIQQRKDISAWLHKVALRCALTVRRRKSPQSSAPLPPADELPKDELEKISTRASMTLLHEQLDLLPARYRTPLILYYMQGATREETRARLSLTEAALKSRLERGKRMLRRRLTQAGFAAIGLVALLQTASTASAQLASPALQQSTVAVALQVKQAWAAAVQSSAGANSAIPVAQGVQQMMILGASLKGFVVAVVGFGIGIAAMAPFGNAALVSDSPAAHITQLNPDNNAAHDDTEQTDPVAVTVRQEPPAQEPDVSQEYWTQMAHARWQAERAQPTWDLLWQAQGKQDPPELEPMVWDLHWDVRPQQDSLPREPVTWDLLWRPQQDQGLREVVDFVNSETTTVSALQARIKQLERELQVYRRLFELEQENAQLREQLRQSDN